MNPVFCFSNSNAAWLAILLILNTNVASSLPKIAFALNLNLAVLKNIGQLPLMNERLA
jgi:hypothetical protein